MTTTTIHIGCGSAKEPGLPPEKDKYSSTYFALKRDYAEANGGEWYIPSAKYGIIKSETLIDDYDVTIEDGITSDQWNGRIQSSISGHPDRVDSDRLELQIERNHG